MGKSLMWIGSIWIAFGWFMFVVVSTSVTLEHVPPIIENFADPSLIFLTSVITLHMLLYIIPGLIVLALGKILTYYENPTN